MSTFQTKARLVQDFLEASAARLPDKVALVCGGRRLTYAEIDQSADRLANALRHHGIQRGDRVAICLKNCAEAVIGMFATLKAGATFVAINHTTKDDKLVYILNNCGATALWLDARRAEPEGETALFPHVSSLKCLVVCGKEAAGACRGRSRWLAIDALLADFPPLRPPPVNIDLDLACLIYTSGTTGESKGVMCGHSNMVFVTGSIVEYLQNTETDVVLNVLQIAFSYGLYQVLAMFAVGGTLVLEESFAFPAVIFQRIREEKATGFAGIPTIHSLLLGMDLTGRDLPSLRYFTNAAAALAVDHVKRLHDRFPKVAFFSMHGLTEVARTVYLPPDQVDRRPGSVGMAIPGTEVWLEDESGRRVGPGEVGEMVLRGRHVMRGYWGDPEATAKRFRPGPLPGERVCYSGDLFRMDEEGYLYFVSRKDDIIKTRGEKVAPKEVENMLYRLEAVLEAAVVGVPDPLLGQAVKAFVVARDPALTELAVLEHCKAHLEDFMVPRCVEFRAELPKTGSGKIRKIDLT